MLQKEAPSLANVSKLSKSPLPGTVGTIIVEVNFPTVLTFVNAIYATTCFIWHTNIEI